MPPGLDNANASVRAKRQPVFTDCPGANADEAAHVMVVGIHVSLLPRRKAVEVGDTHCGGRIEGGIRRLDADEEARLLAETGRVWHFVGMHYCHTDKSVVSPVGEENGVR